MLSLENPFLASPEPSFLVASQTSIYMYIYTHVYAFICMCTCVCMYVFEYKFMQRALHYDPATTRFLATAGLT